MRDDTFEKTAVGALNTMAVVILETLIRRGLTSQQATNITNEILSTTVDIITGKREAIITHRGGDA